MVNKTYLSILIVPIFLILILIGSGCSTRYDEVWYQAPNWTPEGLIYFQKSIVHNEKQPMGTIHLGTDYEYWTMTVDGTQETKLSYTSYPYYSPGGTYVAFVSNNNISIVRRADNYELNNFSPTTESISELDWGPNEEKLTYITDSNNLFIVHKQGIGNTQIATNAATVAWRVGQKIAYGFLYIINSDGTNNTYLTDGGNPQIMNSGKILYYADLISPGEYKIKSIYPSGTDEADVMSSYDKNSLKLSYDNSKVVGGKSLKSGVWIMNIDGSGLNKLK